jgi:hypothetical protein
MVIMIERPGLPPLRIEENLPGKTIGPYKGPMVPITKPLPPKGPYDGPIIPITKPLPPMPPKKPYYGPEPITRPLPPNTPKAPRYGVDDFFSPTEVVKRKPWGKR